MNVSNDNAEELCQRCEKYSTIKLYTCNDCKLNICDNCVVTCLTWHKQNKCCLSCVKSCSVCHDVNSCVFCLHTCPNCQKQICEKCIDWCIVCDELVCCTGCRYTHCVSVQKGSIPT